MGLVTFRFLLWLQASSEETEFERIKLNCFSIKTYGYYETSRVKDFDHIHKEKLVK